MGGSV